MNANELMIGDVVMLSIEFLKETCQPFVSRLNIENIAAIDNGQLVAYPIPLTEGILKANGWRVLSNFDRDTYYSEHGEFNLDFHNGDFRLIINSHVVIIKYVHQLQRILRCCNLYELADNFKVTTNLGTRISNN